jgi:hypothetical protein
VCGAEPPHARTRQRRSPNFQLLVHLNRTLDSLTKTSESLGEFTDYLRRNPGVLIRGSTRNGIGSSVVKGPLLRRMNMVMRQSVAVRWIAKLAVTAAARRVHARRLNVILLFAPYNTVIEGRIFGAMGRVDKDRVRLPVEARCSTRRRLAIQCGRAVRARLDFELVDARRKRNIQWPRYLFAT